MSNVIHLNLAAHRQTRDQRLGALISNFASQRRVPDDVFWLKENAELLNILECTGTHVGAERLAPHEGFYTSVERRVSFFPQYYRFLLSICLDLEDLGMPGSKGEALAAWVAREELVGAELSDLQRAEARRLLQRRGAWDARDDAALVNRLHEFMERTRTFAIPNKKACYELTHIVFCLSEYGRHDPEITKASKESLEFAGLLAFLDQDADLLAEICIALRYAGVEPSAIWEGWLARETHQFLIETGQNARAADDYHTYFVGNWAMGQCGDQIFNQDVAPGRLSFHRPAQAAAPLRQISEYLFHLRESRSDDWYLMRPLVENCLSEEGYAILKEAQSSSPRFEAFFAQFARASQQDGIAREAAL